MNIALWAVQVILAVAFAMAGALKLARTNEELERRMAYVEDLTPQQVNAIGAVEVAGAVALVVPWATGIAPILTPLAAVGFVIVMIGAALLHARRDELPMIAPNIVLGAAAAFVAVGRF